MLEWFDKFLTIIMGSTVGVFLGHGIYAYWHYRTYLGLYVLQSAPWYTSSLIYGFVAVIVLVVSFILKIIIRKIRNK